MNEKIKHEILKEITPKIQLLDKESYISCVDCSICINSCIVDGCVKCEYDFSIFPEFCAMFDDYDLLLDEIFDVIGGCNGTDF